MDTRYDTDASAPPVPVALIEHKVSEEYNSPKTTMYDNFLETDQQSWPPLPDQYLSKNTAHYFRQPDIQLSASGKGTLVGSENKQEYILDDLICKKMTELGLRIKRGGITQLVRGLGAAALCATGVGAIYMSLHTRNIPPGQIGFYTTMEKNPRFVRAGLSLEHNPFHGNFQRFNLTEEHINFQNHVHIIRIAPGHYGLSYFNGNARILLPGKDQTVGVHVICDTQFRFMESILATTNRISVGPLHFVNVKAGYLVPIRMDQKYFFLFPGNHVLECANVRLTGEKSMNETCILGDICHYVVRPGELGAIQVDGKTQFIAQPQSLWIKSSFAKFMECQPLKEEMVTFGPLTRLVVDDYRKGLIRNRQGDLVVLPSGVHIIEQPEVHLTTTSGEWNHCRSEMRAITADPLDVKLRMTMTYHVVDPIAFFKAGEPDKAFKTIEQMAQSVMSEIIRHMRFEETLKRFVDDKNSDDEKEDKEQGELDYAPAAVIHKQWEQLSSKFTQNFKRILKRDFGVEMDETVWGFQDFDLVDQKIQDQLSEAVLARSQARAERVRLNLTKDTASVRKENAKIEADREKYEQTLKAHTKKEIELLNMHSMQEVEDARVNAEHTRKTKQREIDIADSKAKVDAEFYKVQRKADAKAYAIKAQADAESELVQKNPIHFELERARIQATMYAGMKPKVFLGDPGKASFQEAMGRFVGTMTDRMGGDTEHT